MARKRLTPEQYIAIKWLSLPKHGGLTYEQIAEKAGVSKRTVHNWRHDDLFERELKRQMVRNSQDKLPELIESLSVIAIRDGNAAMAKLVLQINDMLVDKHEVKTDKADDDVDYDALDDEIEAFEGVNAQDSETQDRPQH